MAKSFLDTLSKSGARPEAGEMSHAEIMKAAGLQPAGTPTSDPEVVEPATPTDTPTDTLADTTPDPSPVDPTPESPEPVGQAPASPTEPDPTPTPDPNPAGATSTSSSVTPEATTEPQPASTVTGPVSGGDLATQVHAVITVLDTWRGLSRERQQKAAPYLSGGSTAPTDHDVVMTVLTASAQDRTTLGQLKTIIALKQDGQACLLALVKIGTSSVEQLRAIGAILGVPQPEGSDMPDYANTIAVAIVGLADDIATTITDTEAVLNAITPS